MNRTITFDYQLCFSTKEISNVVANLMLSPEFESEESAIAEQVPEQNFSRCLALSQVARKLHQA